jgi:hypothetical protein
LIGGVGLTSAQNVNEEYREWQRAQRQAQRECRDYQRSGSRDEYRECLRAQQRAQRELMEYQRTNSGFYDNGYNRTVTTTNTTVFDPRTGRVYRVYNNGRYYNTDSRGVNLLRQAVNSGYQQGYQQGQMDRRYGRRMNYYGNSVYNNGMFGYQSYVARDQYQHYFQQGFQRGYEDGFNSSNRYGYRSGNTANILSGVLNTILNLATQ